MKGYIYILIGAISYGLLSSIVKIAYSLGYDASDVTSIQMLLGALILWIIVLIYKSINKDKETKYTKISNKDLSLLLTVGSVTGLTGIFYYIALIYINASLAVVLLFQFTWISLIIEMVFLKKRPSKEQLIALIPLLIGTLAATNLIGNNIEINVIGIIFGLLSAVSYSVFIIISGKIAPNSNPFTKSAIMVTSGLIITLIAFRPYSLLDLDFVFKLSLQVGLILAILGPVLSTIMFAIGTPLTGPSVASLLGAIELPTVVVTSLILLNEKIELVQFIGVALIIFGIVLPTLLQNKKNRFSRLHFHSKF